MTEESKRHLQDQYEQERLRRAALEAQVSDLMGKNLPTVLKNAMLTQLVEDHKAEYGIRQL